MPIGSYTLVVNTSDGYSDCWEPFFLLLDRYWPELNAPILLNTERAKFSQPTVHAVRSTRVNDGIDRRLTWGECVLRCLELVETPLVLYMQEDYFLEERVDHAVIDSLAALMIKDPSIAQIGLTAFGSRGPFSPTADERLWRVAPRASYRTSLQAALWRVDVMRSYVRPDENGWMFEIYGTRRSWRRPETFLSLNRDREAARRVLPYSMAGIVKGQWWPTVPAFFTREAITMNFVRRGFYRSHLGPLEKLRTLKKLMENPRLFIRGMTGR